MIYDVVIIGAGVIGGMLARELSRYQLSVCLLEKENDVACGASKANSGIIHGGFDPEPGTLKARLNTAGVPLLYQAARELNVPYQNNGSMVCAFGADEHAGLEALYQRGLANSIEQMKLLSGEEARLLEPQLARSVTMVLHVPTAGIICPYELTIAAVGNAMDNGVELKRNFETVKIEKNEVFALTSTAREKVSARWVVNCAGGYADKVAELAGDGFFRIIPRAGEYLLLDKTEGSRVCHTIFQLPSKEGKGILVSPTVDGNLLTGPTASLAENPESRDITAAGVQQVQALAKKSVPTVDFLQVITSFSGVRASVASGDFIVQKSEQVPGLVHTAAIDSPGLTCCVSIAQYVVELLAEDGLTLERKENWNGNREDSHGFRTMTDEEKNMVIQKDPAYGKIVCRCEAVSEGEIRASIRRNPQAVDVDGVKRRTRSGMGRCQGGFCGPYIMKILSEELGIPMEQVTKCGAGSEMVVGRIGEEE